MNDNYWRAISVESIDSEYFPPVPLFLKSSGNYVLYKDAERKFTLADHSRMERSNTEFMYVRSGDMQEIADFLESSLRDVLLRDDLDSEKKGAILYQASINYIIDAFEEPEQAYNMKRCRHLVENMMTFLAKDNDALRSVRSVIAHNYYIYVHSVQVAALNLLAHEKLLHATPEVMTDVGVGSLLMDYGMIFISKDIVRKQDAHLDLEYYLIKQHAQKGYEFLKEAGVFNDLPLTIVRHHHEKFDGNGYPAGLKGDNIPVSAQLSALCVVYAALTLKNRNATSHDQAVRTMRDESGKSFNPELLTAFIDLVDARKGGDR
jgi:HD-GYP domain-containing protein (c-di-GMP phosphodiesterase class II)